VRVDKAGEYMGGTVGVRNSEDKEGSCCVLCVMCVLPSSFMPLFQHVFALVFDVVHVKTKALLYYVLKTLQTWP
jgi:hypothetical protein